MASALKWMYFTEELATRERFIERLKGSEYDILHFSGHAFLNPETPGTSAVRFANSDLRADQVMELPWKKPPYFVFNSACGSRHAVGGQRLVSTESHSDRYSQLPFWHVVCMATLATSGP